MSSESSSRSESPAPTWEDYKEKGNNDFKLGRYIDAVENYSQAIGLNDEEATLWSNRSAANLKLKRYKDAAADAEKAVQIKPDFVKAYNRLHTALCTQGHFDTAARKLESGLPMMQGGNAEAAQLKDIQAAIKAAKDAMAAMQKARTHLENNEHISAKRELGSVATNFPDCGPVLILKAQCDAPTSPDEANALLAAIAHQYSDDSTYLLARATTMYYSGQGSFKNAQMIIREVLSQDPDNTKAAKLLKKIRTMDAAREAGNNAFKAKNYQEAVDKYTEAIALDPANKRFNSTLYGNRGAAFVELKNFERAKLDCDYAINNGNDAAKVYARRSRVHENLEQWEDAQRDMQEAVDKDDAYRGEYQQLKVRVKRSKRKDYYKVLGVAHNVDEAGLKRAYKKAALQWHPDKWAHSSEEEKTNAEKKFKEVGEAYGLLSDPKKRRMYDNGQIENDVEGDPANHGGMGGFGGGDMGPDMMNMFNMMFAGGGGMGGMGGMPGGMGGMGGMPGGMGGMGGMPGGMGGMPRGGSAGRGRRGHPGGVPPGFSFSFQ